MADTQSSSAAPGSMETLKLRRKELVNLEEQCYAKMGPLSSNLEQFWLDIPLKDGWISRTLVVHPKHDQTKSTNETRPLIIHFHGGGWLAGSPSHMAWPARIFAERFNATVLSPSYKFSPENPWPQPQQSALEVVQIVAANPGYQFGADPTHGFIVGGASAGGGLAGVIAGLTSSDPQTYPLAFPITGVFLSITMLFVEEIIPAEYKSLWTSREDLRHVEGFNTAGIEEILLHHKCTDYTSPLFSPVNLFTTSSSTVQSNYPPTYLQGTGKDPLRDDPVVFEKMLAKAGVKTKIHSFPDDVHTALTTFNVIFGTESKEPNIEDGSLEGMAWLLAQSRPSGQA